MNEYFKSQFLSKRAGYVFIYKRELSTINNLFSLDIAQQSLHSGAKDKCAVILNSKS